MIQHFGLVSFTYKFFSRTLNTCSSCVLQLYPGFFSEAQSSRLLQMGHAVFQGECIKEAPAVFQGGESITPNFRKDAHVVLQGQCITPNFSNDESQSNLRSLPNRPGVLSAVSVDYQAYNFSSLEGSCTGSNAVGSDNNIGTGIKIRTRQPRSQASAQNPVTQGTAPKRIRLQTKLQVGSVSCSKPKDLSHGEENYEVKPLVIEVRDHFPMTLVFLYS